MVQSPREGLGHAIYVASEAFADSDDIMIVLGDTIFDVDLRTLMQSPHSTVGVQVVEDPRKFGVAMLDQDGVITSVKEKPKIPKSNLALVGIYFIREVELLISGLKAMIENGERGDRGEFHLTDGLMKMIEQGVQFKTHMVDNWFDCGRRDNPFSSPTGFLWSGARTTRNMYSPIR